MIDQPFYSWIRFSVHRLFCYYCIWVWGSFFTGFGMQYLNASWIFCSSFLIKMTSMMMMVVSRIHRYFEWLFNGEVLWINLKFIFCQETTCVLLCYWLSWFENHTPTIFKHPFFNDSSGHWQEEALKWTPLLWNAAMDFHTSHYACGPVAEKTLLKIFFALFLNTKAVFVDPSRKYNVFKGCN